MTLIRRRRFGQREADAVEAGHLGEEGVVAAGGLRPALQDVSGHDRAGQRIPVVAGPPVMPGRRPADQRRVGRSPVTTTVAPAESASTIPQQPRYGSTVTGAGSSSPSASRGTEPATEATGTSRPSRPARARTASAQPVGLSPPALTTTRTFALARQPQAVFELSQEGGRVPLRRVLHRRPEQDEHRELTR